MPGLFGTSGVRGVVNEGMTSELALRLGRAFGRQLAGKGRRKPSVAVARDSRLSADMLASAVSAGLMASGCDVLDLGMLPVPAAQYFVGSHAHVAGGVMVTASHNPPEFNGFKLIAGDGTELDRIGEEAVESLYAGELPCRPWNAVGSAVRAEGAAESYVSAVLKHVDVQAVRRAGLKAVVDCANGASSAVTPLLLKQLNVSAVTLNADPQGAFPGHPSEPVEENLGCLMSLVESTGADLGIAHDCDGDRAVFVSEAGRFISGDRALALLAPGMLTPERGRVVLTTAASRVVEDAVAAAGGSVVYTPVGSPAVVRKMREVDAAFGGGEGGGMVFPEFQLCRDGAMAVAKMLEFVAAGGPLQPKVDALPEYHMVRRGVPCPDALKAKAVARVRELFSGRRTEIIDGVRTEYEDGWVLARPSGTEPLFRVYSESKDAAAAEARAGWLSAEIESFVASAATPSAPRWPP